jgi:hypothetical protein
MPTLVQAGEPSAPRRRVYFDLRAADGITPALGEAGGQPQANADGAGWSDSGVGVLVAMGFGRYYADLAPAAVAAAGVRIETRYKSAATAECPGDSAQVVAFDPAADAWGGALTAAQAGFYFRGALAVLVGNVAPETSDHTQTTFKDAIDGTTTRVTSAQTPTTRTVTVH